MMVMKVSINELNAITDKIIGAAIEVHRQLGQGLLESTYEKCLIFELERIDLPVESILPVHEAQILTDLKLSGTKLGLLLNFNVKLMKDGIRRFAN